MFKYYYQPLQGLYVYQGVMLVSISLVSFLNSQVRLFYIGQDLGIVLTVNQLVRVRLADSLFLIVYLDTSVLQYLTPYYQVVASCVAAHKVGTYIVIIKYQIYFKVFIYLTIQVAIISCQLAIRQSTLQMLIQLIVVSFLQAFSIKPAAPIVVILRPAFRQVSCIALGCLIYRG